MKTIFTLILVVAGVSSGFGQKLKSDGFQIILNSLAPGGDEIIFKGSENYKSTDEKYFGDISVKSKDDQKGNYNITFTKRQDKLSPLVIKNAEYLDLEPTLYYEASSKSFIYNQGMASEAKALVTSDKSIEDIVLSGMLIWLKVDK